MTKYYYKKNKTDVRKLRKIISLGILTLGFFIVSYIFFPLLSWQIYFAPALVNQSIETPIPKTTVVNASSIKSLISQASYSIRGIDYTNAQNWFPGYKSQKYNQKISFFSLSIPKINIEDAIVSTEDYNLTRHLVNYAGTGVPPEKGNPVIFGHSTLPQLFNPKDYKTIFANAYKLKTGDEIFVTVSNITYKYKIFNIRVVDPEDTSPLEQTYDDSYITLITCTPPGTIWKRLVIKARLEKI